MSPSDDLKVVDALQRIAAAVERIADRPHIDGQVHTHYHSEPAPAYPYTAPFPLVTS